jgi:hypothetical protein
MSRFRTRLWRVIRRRSRTEAEMTDEIADEGDRREIERLNAEYTGSYAHGLGQAIGSFQDRSGRR